MAFLFSLQCGFTRQARVKSPEMCIKSLTCKYLKIKIPAFGRCTKMAEDRELW